MRINIKSQKGSVTLYTIIALTVVTIVLVGIYFSIVNKQKSDLEVGQQIKAIYEKDVNNVDDVYTNLVEGNQTPTWPIYTTVGNAPDITGFNKSTTYYVAWDTGTTPYSIDDTTSISGIPPANWYDYTAGVNKWANIKTTGGGNDCYWVWIPRYAYRINSGNYHTSTAGTIDIKFLSGTTNTPIDGSSITIANASGSGNWNVAPAFTNAGNGGFGELTGIWVAKFDASSNMVGVEPGFGGTPLGGTSYLSGLGGGPYTNQQVRAIPNVTMWRGISINDIFTVCRSMTNSGSSLAGTTGIDSHLIKNTEWGAAAYLSMSIYGKNSRVWNNPYYSSNDTFCATITGLAGATVTSSQTNTTNLYEYNTSVGINASTSSNVYGIYDMAGGSWEYVAAYVNNGDSNLTTNCLSLINAAAKYKDVYAVGSTDVDVNNYTAASGKYGDAVYETSASGNADVAWDNTNAYMPSWSEPVFIRGGRAYSNMYVGLFSFNIVGGQATQYETFRPVLVCQQP